jgi:hypothetical protein
VWIIETIKFLVISIILCSNYYFAVLGVLDILVQIRIPGFVPLTRVVDPYSFFTDPDPELDVGGQYGSGSKSNTDPGLK